MPEENPNTNGDYQKEIGAVQRATEELRNMADKLGKRDVVEHLQPIIDKCNAVSQTLSAKSSQSSDKNMGDRLADIKGKYQEQGAGSEETYSGPRGP